MPEERVTRRLAAILAADVVGYSRLMGRDESGTLARLKAYRTQYVEPALARRGGRIVKLTGDGLLMEFGSAVDALGAAIELQQIFADANRDSPADNSIVFRVGLHLGDLIVDGDDLYGDGVNVAARLEAEAPPGGIVVSRNVQEAVVGRLPATFDDLGDLALKNIERPVRAFRVGWQAADWPMTTLPATSQPATSVPGAVDLPLALPDKPSIVVLPFANMSNDAEQEYFADGVTEDIITELSRFHELFVIARNSSFTYKGRAVDVRNVAAELGVRYVLEGSIRKAGQRIRVTGQLIDAASGNHIWAERYDRILEDIFAVQEELTQSIVGAIAPHIRDAEVAKARRRPGSLGAYEIAVRANAKAWEAYGKSDSALRDEAISEARAALAIDGSSTIALNALVLAQWQHVLLGTADREAALRDGMAAADRSIEVDRNGNLGHTWRGVMLAFRGDGTRSIDALASARRGHELNPHDSLSLVALGFIEINEDEAESATGHLLQALRVSPRDPLRHMMFHQLARASLLSRRYADGIDHALAAIREAPNLPVGHIQLALNRVGLGDIALARVAFDETRRLSPRYAEQWFRPKLPVACRNPSHSERIRTFARIAAGLEEPDAAEAVR